MTKVYSIVSNKGGILKTTLCVNISAEISKKNRTLVVDTDGQSNVAVSFPTRNSDFKYTLFDCLANGIDIKETIVNIQENLDIIPAGKGMNSFIKKDNRSVLDLKAAIDSLKADYKYIFIDTAPSMNFATLQAMVASDEIIIPFQAEGYGMVSILNTIKAIQEVKNNVNPALKINSIVITKYDSRSKVHKNFLKDIRNVSERLGIELASTKIPHTLTGANSIFEEQTPTVFSKKWNKLKGIYSNLTREISSQ
ncbi:ATPase involved in chromosome partitioning [Mycobacteroides abscessus subsp. abscessus]|nr:ATPase involved in chromosome partitioning [Mycobacteroides abscessus subsp. abscessus]